MTPWAANATVIELLEQQQHELATLRAFAAERSPFYGGCIAAWVRRR